MSSLSSSRRADDQLAPQTVLPPPGARAGTRINQGPGTDNLEVGSRGVRGHRRAANRRPEQVENAESDRERWSEKDHGSGHRRDGDSERARTP